MKTLLPSTLLFIVAVATYACGNPSSSKLGIRSPADSKSADDSVEVSSAKSFDNSAGPSTAEPMESTTDAIPGSPSPEIVEVKVDPAVLPTVIAGGAAAMPCYISTQSNQAVCRVAPMSDAQREKITIRWSITPIETGIESSLVVDEIKESLAASYYYLRLPVTRKGEILGKYFDESGVLTKTLKFKYDEKSFR